jgi:hypothetical protein
VIAPVILRQRRFQRDRPLARHPEARLQRPRELLLEGLLNALKADLYDLEDVVLKASPRL